MSIARVGDRYSVRTYSPRRSVQSFMIGPMYSRRQHEVHPHDRLAELLDLALVGHLLRRVDFERLAAVGRDLVGDVRRRLHQVDVGILLEPLLHDLHVQQAQEAAAEAEAQRVARSPARSRSWGR